jgi:hypothetical protein
MASAICCGEPDGAAAGGWDGEGVGGAAACAAACWAARRAAASRSARASRFSSSVDSETRACPNSRAGSARAVPASVRADRGAIRSAASRAAPTGVAGPLTAATATPEGQCHGRGRAGYCDGDDGRFAIQVLQRRHKRPLLGRRCTSARWPPGNCCRPVSTRPGSGGEMSRGAGRHVASRQPSHPLGAIGHSPCRDRADRVPEIAGARL